MALHNTDDDVSSEETGTFMRSASNNFKQHKQTVIDSLRNILFSRLLVDVTSESTGPFHSHEPHSSKSSPDQASASCGSVELHVIDRTCIQGGMALIRTISPASSHKRNSSSQFIISSWAEEQTEVESNSMDLEGRPRGGYNWTSQLYPAINPKSSDRTHKSQA